MGRAPCCAKVGLNRGRWTAQEDETLTKYIQTHGEGSWRDLPKNAGLLRCGKSCRLRWINYLRSDLKRGNISEEEEQLIIKLHGLLGNRWSLIAGRMQGRTDNEIKNFWNTHLSRKLADRGINPVTHKPFCCNFSLQPKKDSKPELNSSIESSTSSRAYKKSQRNMKKQSTVMTGTCKRKKPWTEKGALMKKMDPMEKLSSRISDQSSCKPSSEMNPDEDKLKSQAQKLQCCSREG
ncbi:hypothetical protein KI387_010581 [Taxus chinensis]|uniref:MYB transcription factor n=1 Tax=Taxus chinensis TaxID=29808 RepID=A0AA38FLB1_TAXCH|nr:hypothetical protein KI387_010581 [Taxus chinensis]